MNAQITLGILTVGTSFAPETSAVSAIFYWEGRELNYLIAMQVGNRHLSSRDTVEIIFADIIHLIAELGKLSYPKEALPVYKKRWKHFSIAVP
jgi:hypothetical protein